ncbi:MAG TPA: hypothetical protein VKV26_25110 [Dehalococcoidia bacterium]|nr:hypothetical protein [Dehalococcoidia bacterium]
MPIKDKYLPLGAHLRRLAGEHSDVTLTFAEIERIIGASLPRGSQSVPFWQGVHGKPPPRARAWLAAGFVAQPDLAHSRIRFHRQAPAARGPQPGGRR